jgi:class 3 adenylate cyclase
MERPKTHYAKLDDLHVAWQVFGKESPDILVVSPYLMHVEAVWETLWAPYYEGLAQLGRVVIFDAIGSGLSDPLPGRQRTIDYWTNDALAVMEAAGMTRAIILGYDSAGAGAMLFAATYPERVSSLILVNTFARALKADDYPWGLPPELRDAFVDDYQARWGTGSLLRRYLPTADLSGEDIERHAWMERLLASPGTVRTHMSAILDSDVRAALPLIQAPTLVVHSAGNQAIPAELGRYVGATIPDARYVELPGDEHFPYGSAGDALLGEIREFVTGVREAPVTERVLSTILFTDVVGSTERAAELGDREWRRLLSRHHTAVRQELGRWRGREIDTAGDGFFAAFDGPARAIRCAMAIRDAVRGLGLEVRAGVHTGECEQFEGKLTGIAVHVCARIMAGAPQGEIRVSRTVKDLTAGSGVTFEDLGTFELKGVLEPWQIYRVA